MRWRAAEWEGEHTTGRTGDGVVFLLKRQGLSLQYYSNRYYKMCFVLNLALIIENVSFVSGRAKL